MVTVAPIRPSNSTVVVTSLRCGTFATVTGSSASSAPARIGRVAFLAPEMRTSPSRGTPPWICSLSMSDPSGRRGFCPFHFFGCQRFDGQRVYLISHALAQRFVDELVARETALARKFGRHDARGEVGVVIRLDSDVGAGQAGPDELCDLFRVHGAQCTRGGPFRGWSIGT